jgi:hypothetical protein
MKRTIHLSCLRWTQWYEQWNLIKSFYGAEVLFFISRPKPLETLGTLLKNND